MVRKISGNEFNSTNILNYKKYHQLHGKSIPKMVIVSYIFLFVFDNKTTNGNEHKQAVTNSNLQTY